MIFHGEKMFEKSTPDFCQSESYLAAVDTSPIRRRFEQKDFQEDFENDFEEDFENDFDDDDDDESSHHISERQTVTSKQISERPFLWRGV
jgi:hypothetical protein